MKSVDEEVTPIQLQSDQDCSGTRAAAGHPRWKWIVLCAVLLLIITVLVRGIGKGEFHLNTDEAHHAATGLFVADFLADLPLAHPLQYTLSYYAHYPVLGIVHWPPFFYFLEGITFLVLGPSVIAARLTVLLCALVGFYFWFRLVSELDNEYAAAASTALLAFLPFLLLYEKAVMLEIPSLALSIVASYFWIRYLREERNWQVYCAALVAGLALLTKQNSVYLATFFLFTIIVERKWRLLIRPEMLRATAMGVVLSLPAYLPALLTHWQDMQYSILKRTVQGNPLIYYWSVLPLQSGSLVLALSILGILTARWWGNRDTSRLMLVWIASCYLTFTALAGKEPRYSIYWLPPFTYFAVAPFTSKSLRSWMRPAGAAIVLAVVGFHASRAWTYQRPYISGYDAAASWLAQRSRGEIILYDADLAANFCFFVRAHDPGRHFVVMRKALYAVRETKEWGSSEFINSRADLEKLIDQFGIRFAVIDDSQLNFKSQEMLREYLETPRFKLMATFPIESNVPKFSGRHLEIYENQDVRAATAKVYRVRMMTLNGDIEIPLDKLGLLDPKSAP